MYRLISAKYIYLFILLNLLLTGVIQAQESDTDQEAVKHFLVLITSDNDLLVNQSLDYIGSHWKADYESLLIETLQFSLKRTVSKQYLELLQGKTGMDFGPDPELWYHWLWNKAPTYPPAYFDFKARLYGLIDPRFASYFSQEYEQTKIRLDEVMWGGVQQDGIPPLRNPKMIPAHQAYFLDEGDIVFGLGINGDFRAYPKRILAWHEMFTDRIGDTAVAGVYCTLCGTVIIYKTELNGQSYQMGTSGFLYRSNKLMYDKRTQSLWSTLEGKPVIGPLVGMGIELPYIGVVTTTWGAWKKRHPDTTVLSLDTGFKRDYSEGAAYKEYFETDELMFQVPVRDDRLKNKDEVLVIRLPRETNDVMAISSAFLKTNPLYGTNIGGIPITIFTDSSGAHRAYATNDHVFADYDQIGTARDAKGNLWILEEDNLISENKSKLGRIPTFNAFWFGFQAAFPDALLIH